MAQLSILAICSALCLPWLLASHLIFFRRTPFDRLLFGLSTGTAATLVFAYVLAACAQLDAYWMVFALLMVAALGAFAIGPRPTHLDLELAPWPIATFAIVVAAEALPVFASPFPHGWDPSFHCILAQKISQSNALAADWLPFEKAPVHYTQGLHALIALVAQWSGQPVHAVFQTLHLIAQPLAALWVYRLARHFLADELAALGAMLCYALLFQFGSFSSYFQWGGLPTQFGAVLFMAAAFCAMAGENKREWALFPLFFGAMTMTHHLSALIYTWVLLFFIAASTLARTDSALRNRLCFLLALTALLFSPYLLPYAARSAQLGETDALHYAYDSAKDLRQVAADMGYIATILSLVGLALVSRANLRRRTLFPLCWTAASMAGFVLLGYGYRLAASLVWNEDATAFTPSRFLTVTSYPLALYAGWTLRTIIRTLALPERPLLALVYITIIAVAAPDIYRLTALRTVSDRGYQIAKDIRELVPEGAFVAMEPELQKRIGPIEWLPYLTWRPQAYTPLPASEERAALREKMGALNSRNPAVMLAWLRENIEDGYAVSLSADGILSARRIERWGE